jgi:hypothetical protein
MNKKYIVELTSQERTQLREIVSAKRMAAHRRRHARMLLKLDQGPDGPAWPDTQVAAAFDCTARSAERLRRRLVEGGLEAALQHGNCGSYRARAWISGDIWGHHTQFQTEIGKVSPEFAFEICEDDHWPD